MDEQSFLQNVCVNHINVLQGINIFRVAVILIKVM